MIRYDALIHDRKYFELDHLQQRQTKYNFTQAVKVETFLWDLELFGQLQGILREHVILKGGAAAQLFFPPERQRTSVDIDVIYSGDEETLSGAFRSIHQAFGADEVFFKFNKHIPTNPKTTLPLETYFVSVPTATGGPTPINVKVDVHLMKHFNLQTVELEEASAFVVPLVFKPRCLSAEALVGDKLLTLAQGSVGIPGEREDDIPKQLYDLDGLTRIVDARNIDGLTQAMSVLFDRELSVRSERLPLETALNQAIDLLERYSRLDSHKSDKRARTAIQNFKGNYEPRPFKNAIAWGIASKRLQFILKCISAGVDNPLVLLKNVDQLSVLIKLEEERFNDVRARLQNELRVEFVSDLKAKGFHETAGRLKNTQLERLLWEVVTPAIVKEVTNKILAWRKD